MLVVILVGSVECVVVDCFSLSLHLTSPLHSCVDIVFFSNLFSCTVIVLEINIYIGILLWVSILAYGHSRACFIDAHFFKLRAYTHSC